MSVIINNRNVKIFNNGVLQITGCKGLDEWKDISYILMGIMKKVNGFTNEKLELKDNVIISESQRVYTINGICYGYINNSILYSKDKKYHRIHFRDDYLWINYNFYQISENTMKKDILSHGETIGFQLAIFKNSFDYQNRNNFFYFKEGDRRLKYNTSKKTSYTEFRDIYDKYGGIVGVITPIFLNRFPIKPVIPDKVYYNAIEEVYTTEITHKIGMIKIDSYIGYSFIKDLFIEKIRQIVYPGTDIYLRAKYDSDIYQGITIRYYPARNRNCICEKQYKCKCKYSIMCFPSGKISITGKIYSEIEEAYVFIKDIFDKLKFEIQVKAT